MLSQELSQLIVLLNQQSEQTRTLQQIYANSDLHTRMLAQMVTDLQQRSGHRRLQQMQQACPLAVLAYEVLSRQAQQSQMLQQMVTKSDLLFHMLQDMEAPRKSSQSCTEQLQERVEDWRTQIQGVRAQIDNCGSLTNW